jgi:iduronate 2-sulfatase
MKRTFLLLTLSFSLFLAATSHAAERKNVLFFAIDDLRPELACYGHPNIKSPQIDRLASQGLLFERAYCQQAVCAPSRISLLTGLRPDTTGIYDLQHPLRQTKPDVLSMPQYFQRSGYETVSLGKIYHHTGDDNSIGWTGKAWRPEGKWTGRGYLAPDSIRRIQPPESAHGHPGVGPAYEWANVPDEAYPDGTTAVKATEELRRLEKGDKPFFLAVGFVRPHLPFNAPQKYWDLYDRADIKVPQQGAWPKGSPSLAGTQWGELRKYTGMPRSGPMPKDEAINLIHGYYACVSYMDALVGQVVGELERLGLRDDTVIILWGDHGWKLGDYGAWCKHTNFELDTHVPLILSVPGRLAVGRRTKAPVEFVDIFPTLAELCGLDVPDSCEGTSMVPLVEDPDRPWKEAAFSQYPRGKVMGYSLRSGNWRYTEWIDRRTGDVVGRELYDHSAGPAADRNLADEPEFADTVKKLSALLDGGQGWQVVRKRLSR